MRFARPLAAVWAITLGAAASGAETIPVDDKAMLEALGMPADTKLLYVDEKGASLTREEFMRRMATGGSMVMEKAPGSHQPTMRLQSAAVTAQREAADKAAQAKIRFPELDAAGVSGKRFRTADLAGRPTLVSFFFEACGPCIKEVPVLNAFAKQHPEYNYLAITPDDAETARRFVKDRALDWPVLADAGAFIKSAGVTGYPTYLLLDTAVQLKGTGSGFDTRATRDLKFGVQELETWVGEQLK